MELDEVLTKVNNNELDSMSAAELGDTLVFLGGLGKPEGMSQDQYNEVVRKVVEAYSAKAQEAQAQKAEEPKPEVSDEQLTRNATELNRNAEHLTLSDDVKLALENMQVVKDDGSETTVAEEITEAAQLRVATDNITNDEPMSQEAYNNAVEQEIDNIMMAIYTARGRSNPNNQSQTDAQKNAEDLQNLYAGQPSQVDEQTVASTLALHVGATEEKIDQQSSWFPKNEFIKGMKSKVSSLYNKLSAKLGKKFDQAKAVVATMKKQGTLTEALVGGGLAGVSGLTAIAGASVAGAVALPLSAAMGVYSVWTAGRRIAPLYKKYKEEKAKLGEQFDRKAFFAEHKKEVRNAVLYTGAGVLGATAGVLGVMNSVAAAGQGLTAARAAASFGRTGLLVTNANAPFISDLMNAETKAERKNAFKRILQSLGTTAAIITVASVAGSAHAAETGGTEVGATGSTPADSLANGGEVAAPAAGAQGTDVPDTDAPATNDGNTTGTGNAQVDDAQHYTVDAPSEKVQHFYEQKLQDESFIPRTDVDRILNNIDNIERPENMTIEQAINLARDERVWYQPGALLDICDVDGNPVVKIGNHLGSLITDDNGTYLKIGNNMFEQMADSRGHSYFDFGDGPIYGTPKSAYLIDVLPCDEINVDTASYLKQLDGAFVTEQNYHTPNGEFRGLNAPTDPNYKATLNVRTTIHVDGCDPSTITNKHVNVTTPVSHTPVTVNPVTLEHQAPIHIDTPETVFEAPELHHVDSANELITPDPDKPVVEVTKVAGNHQGGHYNNANEYYQDHNDGSAAKASSDKSSDKVKMYKVRGIEIG